MLTRKKINKYIICFIMVFPLVIPEGMAVLSGTFYSIIYRLGRVLAFGIIVLFYSIKAKNHKAMFPAHLRISMILALYCLAVTIFRGHNPSDWLSAFWPCIMAGLVVEYGKKDTIILINTLLIVLEFWIYINLLFIILYPNGMYTSTIIGYTKNWILGYKSSFQYYIYPAVILGWLKSEYGGSKVRFWVLMIASAIETFLSENAMLMVAIVVIALFYLFKLLNLNKLFNPIAYSMIILVINVLILFSLTLLVNTQYGALFLKYYGKSATLGGRGSYIWPITMQKISESPLFGYGIWSSDERRALYLNRPAAIHAHNQLLEMLFIGGIVFIVLYTLFHLKMLQGTRNSEKKPATRILLFGLFVFYCMMAVEIFLRQAGFAIWILIYLAFKVSEIDEQFAESYSISKRKNKIRIRV